MSGESEEIAVYVLHINRHVRNALRSVNKYGSAYRAGLSRELLYRIDGAYRVRLVRHRQQSGSRPDYLVNGIHIERVVIRKRQNPQFRILLHRNLLPRHQVAVMLHRRDHNLVAGFDVIHRPAMGNKVNSLGRVTRPYQALRALRVYEVRDFLPRLFISRCGLHAERMHPTMNIRVVTLVVVHQRLNNLARLLRSCSRV